MIDSVPVSAIRIPSKRRKQAELCSKLNFLFLFHNFLIRPLTVCLIRVLKNKRGDYTHQSEQYYSIDISRMILAE